MSDLPPTVKWRCTRRRAAVRASHAQVSQPPSAQVRVIGDESSDIHALVSLLLTGVQRVVVLRDSRGAGPRKASLTRGLYAPSALQKTKFGIFHMLRFVTKRSDPIGQTQFNLEKQTGQIHRVKWHGWCVTAFKPISCANEKKHNSSSRKSPAWRHAGKQTWLRAVGLFRFHECKCLFMQRGRGASGWDGCNTGWIPFESLTNTSDNTEMTNTSNHSLQLSLWKRDNHSDGGVWAQQPL